MFLCFKDSTLVCITQWGRFWPRSSPIISLSLLFMFWVPNMFFHLINAFVQTRVKLWPSDGLFSQWLPQECSAHWRQGSSSRKRAFTGNKLFCSRILFGLGVPIDISFLDLCWYGSTFWVSLDLPPTLVWSTQRVLEQCSSSCLSLGAFSIFRIYQTPSFCLS